MRILYGIDSETLKPPKTRRNFKADCLSLFGNWKTLRYRTPMVQPQADVCFFGRKIRLGMGEHKSVVTYSSKRSPTKLELPSLGDHFTRNFEWTRNGWTTPSEKNMIVKMGSSSPIFEVNIQKMFQKPPPSWTNNRWHSVIPPGKYSIHRALGV